MLRNSQTSNTIVIDRQLLMQLKTCPACGRKFNLGESAIQACGPWDGPPKWVHEEEAVYDQHSCCYVTSDQIGNDA